MRLRLELLLASIEGILGLTGVVWFDMSGLIRPIGMRAKVRLLMVPVELDRGTVDVSTTEDGGLKLLVLALFQIQILCGFVLHVLLVPCVSPINILSQQDLVLAHVLVVAAVLLVGAFTIHFLGLHLF